MARADDSRGGRVNLAWYLARTGGIVGFVLLTTSAVLGLTLAGKARLARWPRFAIEDVHRYAGMLAGVFIWLHVLVFLFDSYLNFGVLDLLVPGAAPYRPVWTALGVVAAELLLAVAITNRYRKRLPYAYWRRAHMVNFLVWSLALAHGVTAGSDTDTSWARFLYMSCAGAVAAASAWRITRTRRAPRWAVALFTVTAGIVGGELVLALALGPLGQGAA